MPVNTKSACRHGTWSFVDSCQAHTSPWVVLLQPCAVRELQLFGSTDHRRRCPGGFASAGMAQLILGAVFPVGLIITVLTGAELFTGDAMLAPMAAFIHKVTWAQVLNLWLWVYIGNFIGSVVWAYICANGPFVTFDAAGVGTVTAFGTRAIAIATAKTSYVGLMGILFSIPQGYCLQLARQPRYPARYLCR
jgi:hypothetical protein